MKNINIIEFYMDNFSMKDYEYLEKFKFDNQPFFILEYIRETKIRCRLQIISYNDMILYIRYINSCIYRLKNKSFVSNDFLKKLYKFLLYNWVLHDEYLILEINLLISIFNKSCDDDRQIVLINNIINKLQQFINIAKNKMKLQ